MTSSFGTQILDFFALSAPRKKQSNSDDTFIDVLRQHNDLWKECFVGDCIVCCPVSASIGTDHIPKEQLMSHILVPGRIPGEFISLNGQHIHISSNYLICGVGFKESRKVKILGVGQLSDSWGKTITTYQLSRPLVGGISNSPDEVDEMSSAMMFKYVATLRSYPELESAFAALDDYVREVRMLGRMSSLEGYSKIKPSLSSVLKVQWQKTCDRITRTGALTTTMGGGSPDVARRQIAQIIESYMMHGLVEFVYPWLCRRMDSSRVDDSFKISSIHAVVSRLAHCTQSDLGICPEFQTSQSEAVKELCTLADAQAPVDKMLVMKRTVSLVRDAVDRNVTRKFSGQEADIDFATDDLVLLLIWVVIQAYPKHRLVAADILYCTEFHFSSASRSQLGYNLCHFEVAMSWFTDRSRCCISRSSADDTEIETAATITSDCIIPSSDPVSDVKLEVTGDIAEVAADMSEMEAVRRLSIDMCNVESQSPLPVGNSTNTSYTSNGVQMPSLLCVDNLRANIVWTRETLARQQHHSSYDNANDIGTILNPRSRSPEEIQEFSCSPRTPVSATSSGKAKKTSSSISVLHTQPRGSSTSSRSSRSPLRIVSEELNRDCQVKYLCCREDYHCALTVEGGVYTWGRPDCGRLGRSVACELDSFQDVAVPRLINSLDTTSRVKQLSCGKSHMMAVTDNGEVFVWGDNRCGQLGLFDLSIKASDKTAARIAGSSSGKYSALTELMLASELSVVCATGPTVLQAVRHIKMAAVACGAYHSLCLAADGQVYSWGRAANGRLGHCGDKSSSAEHLVGRPALVRCRWLPEPPLFEDDLEDPQSLIDITSPLSTMFNTPSSSQRTVSIASTDYTPTPSKVTFIAAGWNYSLAITECGAVYSWGCGTHGVLGHGSHCDEYLPRQIMTLRIPGVRFVSAAVTHHSLFRTSSGLLFGCGLDDAGQVNALSAITTRTMYKLDRTSVLVPRPIDFHTISPQYCVTHVACGEYHSSAVVCTEGDAETQQLLVWGDVEAMTSTSSKRQENERQEEGSSLYVDVSHMLPSGERITMIACGGATVMAITDKLNND